MNNKKNYSQFEFLDCLLRCFVLFCLLLNSPTWNFSLKKKSNTINIIKWRKKKKRIKETIRKIVKSQLGPAPLLLVGWTSFSQSSSLDPESLDISFRVLFFFCTENHFENSRKRRWQSFFTISEIKSSSPEGILLWSRGWRKGNDYCSASRWFRSTEERRLLTISVVCRFTLERPLGIPIIVCVCVHEK